jgi:hypothetical protein
MGLTDRLYVHKSAQMCEVGLCDSAQGGTGQW